MKTIVIVAALLALGGCATTKQWVATGGSRSDGTIKLSFEYNMFEKPQLDNQQGLALAIHKCSAWGYSGAEAFGGSESKCEQMNGYGSCIAWMVTATFQCTGNPEHPTAQ